MPINIALSGPKFIKSNISSLDVDAALQTKLTVSPVQKSYYFWETAMNSSDLEAPRNGCRISGAPDGHNLGYNADQHW